MNETPMDMAVRWFVTYEFLDDKTPGLPMEKLQQFIQGVWVDVPREWDNG